MPGTTISATAIFASKPRPTSAPRQHQPAGAPVLERPDERPQRAGAAQDQQRVGVVVARDRDRDRREREHQAGDEAGAAPEAPAHEVVDERDGRHPHQRLRHQDRERVEAEHAHRERLHPQRERRLVHRHHAGCIEACRTGTRSSSRSSSARRRCSTRWPSRWRRAPTGSGRRRARAGAPSSGRGSGRAAESGERAGVARRGGGGGRHGRKRRPRPLRAAPGFPGNPLSSAGPAPLPDHRLLGHAQQPPALLAGLPDRDVDVVGVLDAAEQLERLADARRPPAAPGG